MIDHIYSNSDWEGKPPVRPHEWDLSLAHEAMNLIILYCDNPNELFAAFAAATGLRGPDAPVQRYGPKDLDRFRREVSRELGLEPKDYYSNPDLGWIVSFPGAV
ncbi:MAG: hypothetical protein WEB06_17145 [Actinomycetota bacterium]